MLINVNIHDTIQFGIIDHRMSSHLTEHLKYTSAVITVSYILENSRTAFYVFNPVLL